MLNHQVSAEPQNVPQQSRSWFNLRTLFVLLFLFVVCTVCGLKIWFPKTQTLVNSIRDHGGHVAFTQTVHPVFDEMYGEIKSITVSNSAGYPIDDNFIESLGELSSLTDLTLGNAENPADITDRGLVRLTKYPLQYLRITGGTISESGWNSLQQIASLKRLDLHDCEISGIQRNSPTSWKSLQTLVLTGSNLTDQDLKNISLIPNLLHLDISNNRFEESGIHHLLNLKKLTDLSINHSEIKPDSLGQLRALKSLRSLNLQGESINDTHMPQIATLQQITSLMLQDSKVTDQGLVSLAKMKNLSELYLTKTQITNEGIKHLTHLQNLTFLELTRTKITDQAKESLLQIPKRARVRMYYTKISNATIDSLRDAGHLISANRPFSFPTDKLINSQSKK